MLSWGNEEMKSSGNEEKSKESTGNKIMEGKTRELEALIRDYLHAASEGKLSDVQISYEKIKGNFHVDVTLEDDDKKLTALMYACKFAHLEVVQFLLEKGASLEATTSVGATPTYYAAGAQGERRLDVLKLCLEYEKEKSSCMRKNVCTRKGRTLPWIAACNGMSDTLEKIISLEELDLNKKSIDGMTPLMIATINGHASCVEVLIKAGVDLHAKIPSGWTAIAIAKALGQDKCLDILKAAILAERKIEFQKKNGNRDADTQ
jgi:ankyrin repeat protein